MQLFLPPLDKPDGRGWRKTQQLWLGPLFSLSQPVWLKRTFGSSGASGHLRKSELAPYIQSALLKACAWLGVIGDSQSSTWTVLQALSCFRCRAELSGLLFSKSLVLPRRNPLSASPCWYSSCASCPSFWTLSWSLDGLCGRDLCGKLSDQTHVFTLQPLA